MDSYVIGIDIGGTNLRMVAMDKSGNVILTQMENSDILLYAGNPVAQLGERISIFAKDLPASLQGICIGFPGTVSKNKDIVYSCPNLPIFTNIEVSRPLERQFGVPVYAEHDIILLMEYDISQMLLDERSCVIGVYLGTGLGNAIWVNGDFIYGADGVAGELGHIPVLGRGDECPCGNRGCIELYTGGRQLEKLAETLFPDTPIRQVFAHHGGDPALATYLDAVGVAIATEVNILNPDCVILGGGVIHMPGFPIGSLQEAVLCHTRKPHPHDSLRFSIASSEKFVGAIGAGRHMWNQLGRLDASSRI